MANKKTAKVEVLEEQIEPDKPTEEMAKVEEVIEVEKPTTVEVSMGLEDQVSGKKWSWRFFLGSVALGVVATVLVFFIKDQMGAKNVSKPETVNTAPTPPKAPALLPVNLTDYAVSVLNGSGKSGVAGIIKEELVSGGFKVTNVGNAETSDFDFTQVEAKKSVPAEVVTKLRDLLVKTYQVATASGTLSATASADVVITVGSLLAK